MFLLPTAQGCYDGLPTRTGSKLRLTSSVRSNATMNSPPVPIARPMARTVSTSPWQAQQTTHWFRHQRDVMLAGRSEAPHRASEDRKPALRRRPGKKAARRTSLPRNRTEKTRPLSPRMPVPGPSPQKPQLTRHVPTAGMCPASWCPQTASRAIMAARAPCTRRASRSGPP